MMKFTKTPVRHNFRMLFCIAFFVLSLCGWAQNEWDGDNPIGNFTYGNNFNPNGSDGDFRTWSSATDFTFKSINNSSQTSMYWDLPWKAVKIIYYDGAFTKSIDWNGNGNGIDLYYKLENYSYFTQYVNIPLSAKGTVLELNPVNGDLVFTQPIYNNSGNPITVYGSKQVTFSGDITGSPGVTINSTATVVYSGVSKTYLGTTTINTGTTLRISSNQTLGNIDLKGGTIIIDSGKTLIITGSYSATGGIINNSGTIKFAGGSVTFPSLATVNNGTASTLTNLEAASSGVVTLNSYLSVSNSITVSAGTLLLGGNDLRLTNAALNIAAGATFDNGGENQIINGGGTSTVSITGTFITRDAQGFVDSNSAIPAIIPTLNSGCTIEYGLNGNQAVQGGTAPAYKNITFSGSGTKTLISGNAISGTIALTGSVIFDAGNNTFGNLGNNITMTGTSIYKLGGSGVKPTANGTYSLGALTSFDFTGTSATDIRLSAPTIAYANVIVSGSNVSNSGTSTGIKFQIGGTFVVKNGATFKLNTTDGFSGGTNTAISNVNNPTITLEAGSTIEYSGANQTISLFAPHYKNVTISGTGTKTLGNPYDTYLDENLNVNASKLLLKVGEIITVNNAVKVVSPAIFEINDTGQLIQNVNINSNTGDIIYKRINTSREQDYTYWSSPVANQQLIKVSPNTSPSMFYSFDSSIGIEGDWVKESTLPANIMTVGKGYIIGGIPPNPPSPPGFWEAPFIGVPNNGHYSLLNIIADRSYLIGNPYPSALDANKFLDDNSAVLDGTLYFWTHNTAIGIGVSNPGTGVYAYSQDDYASYNRTGGTGTAAAISGSGINTGINRSIPNGQIAAGQGFFASSKPIISGSEIVFNNDMRIVSAAGNNSQFFKTRNPNAKKDSSIEKNRIWLNLTNNQGVFKQTLIGYITNATNQYDNRFDGISFDGQKFVDFYSVNDDKNLVIQGRALPFDENDTVPLGFRTSIEGTFKINIDQADGTLSNQAVFLEDKLTNTIFDLRSENYSFTTKPGTFNNRFVLRYTNKTLGNNNFVAIGNQVLISCKNKQININSAVETIDKVSIFDLLGRKIYQKNNVNATELSIHNLVSSQQIIIVKVTLQNGKEVSEKIVY